MNLRGPWRFIGLMEVLQLRLRVDFFFYCWSRLVTHIQILQVQM